jgi:hypothetical protein
MSEEHATFSESDGGSHEKDPSTGRQAELRSVYVENVEAGKAPYDGTRIYNKGELNWLPSEPSDFA